jgi:branched-chain amino acid transport system substrate-binding protein
MRVRSWVRLRRPAVALVAVVSLLLGVVAVGGATPAGAASKGTYTFLYSGDFTGATMAYTQAEVLGLKVAIKQINAKGGIQGKKVVLETQNDQNNPTTAVSLLEQKLTSGQKPDAMYPGGSSEVTQALLPILTRSKILGIDATSSDTLNNPKKYPYYFGDSELSEQTVPPYVVEAKAKGYKKVGMIYGNDVSGQASMAGFKTAFQKAGITFVSASFPDTAVDVTPQLEQLKAQNPDMVIFSGYGVPTLYILKGRAQISWDAPFYADLLSGAFPIVQNLPASSLHNVFIETSKPFLAGNPAATGNPVLNTFVADAKSLGGQQVLNNIGAGVTAVGYNALVLINYAAKQAKSTDGATLSKTLENLKKASAPVPWLSYGTKSQFGNFYYTSKNHYPNVFPTGFIFVGPGTYNSDGLFVPGAGS